MREKVHSEWTLQLYKAINMSYHLSVPLWVLIEAETIWMIFSRRHFQMFLGFFYGNVWILIKISLKFVPKGEINNIPVLVQIMSWRRPGDSHNVNQWWSSLLTHICVLSLNELMIERKIGLINPHILCDRSYCSDHMVTYLSTSPMYHSY